MVKYNVYGSRIGTLMWRINDEAEGRIVNAAINVLDRVHKQYLTMCQTEVTTKNIEFSFLINRLMVKSIIIHLIYINHTTYIL